MFTLPLSTRLARRISVLTRPLRRQRATFTAVKLDDHVLKDIGVTRVDAEAMRRMW